MRQRERTTERTATGYHGPRTDVRDPGAIDGTQVRRVITGHDATRQGDREDRRVSKNVASGRPGATACNIWTTEDFRPITTAPPRGAAQGRHDPEETGRSSASSSSRRVSRRAITAPIDRLHRDHLGRDRHGARRLGRGISRPANVMVQRAPSTTGSTTARRRACWR